jgi:hypothetical protein
MDQLEAIVYFTVDGKQIRRQELHRLLAPGHGLLLYGLHIEQPAPQPIGPFLHEALQDLLHHRQRRHDRLSPGDEHVEHVVPFIWWDDTNVNELGCQA